MTRSEPGPAPKPLRIAVFGAAAASPQDRAVARELGRRLATAGAVVICGGRGGVMEAVAMGCSESGGTVVGLLPGAEARSANPYVSLPLPTGLGEARNALVARAGEAAVAVGGSWGTLSEIALAQKMGVPVAVLGAPPAQGLGLPHLPDALAAAEWALAQAQRGRGDG